MSEDTNNEKISEEGKGSESEEGCTSGDDFFGSKGDDYSSEEYKSGDSAWEDDHETDEENESDGDDFDKGYRSGGEYTSVDASTGIGETRESTCDHESEGDSSYSEGKEEGGKLSVADTHPPPPPRKKRREK